MKRLKMPKIPTRIPLPNLPSIHIRSSQKAKDVSNIDGALAPTTEDAQDTKIKRSGIATPESPSPTPVVSKLSVPEITLPSISMSNISEKSSQQEDKEQPEVNKNVAPTASSTSGTAALEQPRERAKPKLSIHKINMPKMPSLHKAKEKQLTEEPAVSPIPEHEVNIPKVLLTNIHTVKEKTTVSAEAAPKPQADETKTPPKTPEAKAKSKPKISMPNLKLSKFIMPSLALGKSGAKPTGKRILALTIEGTDVRLVSYYNNSIESWKSAPFDARLLKMGQVADAEGLGEIIKSSLAGIETNKCYLVCALPGLRSVSRIITVPNVSKKEMEAVVPREVRRTMTVSEEDNYFHWQVLPSETPQIRVFVLAVPKEPLSMLLRAFNHAGLNPANIDLKPLALMRAVNQKDAIIANCEGNSMELVIVSDDIPVLIRSVFLGEGVVNQDYAVGRISDELGRTIVTYNEINKEHPLDQNIPVYLTGAAAAGVPFALNVAALTGRTVQPLEAPISCPADFPLAQYMVNIGLILKVV